MLELISITKKYKDVYAVEQFNMYIEQGEIVGLLGPNGAGKSTTISVLSSLIAPTSGDVLFHKKSIAHDPSDLRRVTGIVPQEIALYRDLTAEENLQFFGRIYHLKGKDLQDKITDVLEMVGLSERRKKLVKHFSGGMMRRLNIGVALLHNPSCLIMDEPTVGIDPQSRTYILETVKKLNQEHGITVIYTSHYMEEVDFLCDRIYIMDQGKLIASGTNEEIKRILSDEKTVVIEVETIQQSFMTLLENDPSIYQLTCEDKIVSIIIPKEVQIFKEIVQYAEQTETEIVSVDVQTPTLEDVFLHLTGKALRN